MTTEPLAAQPVLDGHFLHRASAPLIAAPLVAAPLAVLPALDRRVQRLVKHFADRLLAALLLLALSPVFVLLVIAVRATTPGPAFYRQERVGKDGRHFVLWKFRTMVQNADHWLPDLLHRHNRQHEPLFKVPDDPRITRVGRWLRRSSLDELPQLINVLLGDMSLVGPRPQRPAEVALYSTAEFARLRVRPGLTGLWQVSGRSMLSWESAVALDLHYVHRWSLAVDARILLRTPIAVLRGHGAC